MKTAEISAVPSGDVTGYAWRWTCSADKTSSATAFTFYYDCVSDAREHGYTVELTRAHGATAPGGVSYRLRRAGE
jgi:hypothetical protein